jgi:hypothetical protein
MVRKVDSWEADDGSIHQNEFDALLASVADILPMSATGIAAILQSDKWPRLLNLFMTLNSPRFLAPKSAKPRPEAPGAELVAVDEVDTRHLGDAPFSPDIEWDDLRIGQLVQTDYGQALIAEISENDRRRVLLDLSYIVGGEGDSVEADFNLISRIIAQPEQLLPLDEARALLAEIEAGDAPDMSTSEGRQAYARRVLLLSRVAELEREDDGTPAAD